MFIRTLHAVENTFTLSLILDLKYIKKEAFPRKKRIQFGFFPNLIFIISCSYFSSVLYHHP